MKKRKVFLLALLLCAVFAQAGTTTLTGNIKDSFGTGINGQLLMYLPVPAQDPSTGTAISPIPVSFRLVNGAITGGAPLWDVNTINPAGLYYIARAYDTTGTLVFYGNYVVTGAGSFNLGTAVPTTVTTSNISYATPAVLSGNQTWTGANTFNGATVFGGNVTMTAGQNSITAFNFNNIVYVDGIKYTNIASCLSAVASSGGTCKTPDNYRETFTSQITGLSNPNNTNPVFLELGKDNILTANVTGGVCAIPVGNGSHISGPPGSIGAGQTNQGGAVIQPSSTANLSALICGNIPSTGTQEYFSLTNLFILDNVSATISGALVDVQAVFVPSFIRDTVIAPQGHIGLRLRNISGAGFGPFTCDNCWLNGTTTAGSQPLVISDVSGGGIMAGINFIGGAIEHAGTGQFEATIDGTAGAASTIVGVNFDHTYCENSFAASSCFKVKDAQNVNFYGISAGATGGTDLINISQSAAGRTFGINVNSLRDASNGFTNLINDAIHSYTITSASASGYLGQYYLGSTDVTVAPTTIFGNEAISGHLNQTATNRFAGTCAMSAGTTCTITINAAYSTAVGCVATAQGGTAFYAACNVSGTTVTLTANGANSATWAAMLFGNPN